MQLLASIFLAFLPHERRHRWESMRYPLTAGTALGAIAEICGGVALTVHFYAPYRAHYMQNFLGGENAGAFLFGATLWIGFLFFSFWGLLAFYLFTEGIIRGLTVAVTFEPCGSLLAMLTHLATRVRPPRREEPVLPDAVTRDDHGVVIATCRARDWDEMTTVELDGEHYLVTGRYTSPPPRKYTFRLTPLPAGRAIRKLVRYPD